MLFSGLYRRKCSNYFDLRFADFARRRLGDSQKQRKSNYSAPETDHAHARRHRNRKRTDRMLRLSVYLWETGIFLTGARNKISSRALR